LSAESWLIDDIGSQPLKGPEPPSAAQRRIDIANLEDPAAVAWVCGVKRQAARPVSRNQQRSAGVVTPAPSRSACRWAWAIELEPQSKRGILAFISLTRD